MNPTFNNKSQPKKKKKSQTVKPLDHDSKSKHASDSPAGVPLFCQRSVSSSVRPDLIQRQFVEEEKEEQIEEESPIQTKLTIGKSNDKYELEADRVADKVMRMPDNEALRSQEGDELSQTKPAADQISPVVQREIDSEGMEEDDETLQTKQTDNKPAKSSHELSARIQSLKKGGQPLPESERSFFEPRFGHNFSQTRVHTSPKAAETAESINAKAYTSGKDIIFGSGQFAPGSLEGKKLLAHELTHVVQQKGVAHDHHADGTVLQRKLKYNRKIPEAEAKEKGYIKEIDESIKALGEIIDKPASDYKPSKHLKEVFTTLLNLRKNNKITCWETSGADSPASYDPLTGEMRIHYYAETSMHPGGRIKRGRSLNTVLVHEATHALHATKYSSTFKKYGKALAKGFEEGDVGLELLKFKAFTEYWAYRRQCEYYNLRQDPEFWVDPHKKAMEERDVKGSIRRIEKETGKPFDPSAWKPR